VKIISGGWRARGAERFLSLKDLQLLSGNSMGPAALATRARAKNNVALHLVRPPVVRHNRNMHSRVPNLQTRVDE